MKGLFAASPQYPTSPAPPRGHARNHLQPPPYTTSRRPTGARHPCSGCAEEKGETAHSDVGDTHEPLEDARVYPAGFAAENSPLARKLDRFEEQKLNLPATCRGATPQIDLAPPSPDLWQPRAGAVGSLALGVVLRCQCTRRDHPPSGSRPRLRVGGPRWSAAILPSTPGECLTRNAGRRDRPAEDLGVARMWVSRIGTCVGLPNLTRPSPTSTARHYRDRSMRLG